MPSLTIVIPAKDEAECLPHLFAALDRQTRRPDEVIVADAASTDATAAIAKGNGAMVVTGGLPGAGRNRGAEAATGELLFFIDADAILLGDDFLERAVDEFEEHGFDIATADITPINGTWFDRFSHALYNRYARMWGSVHPHAPGFCILVRRRLHEAIGGFDETVMFCEDHDYARRASKIGVYGFLNGVRIGVPVRRMDRDGRLNISVKYLLAELHILFLGPIRHDRFKYGFGHKKQA